MFTKFKHYFTKGSIRWTLVFYDALVYTAVAALAIIPYKSQPVFNMTWWDVLYHWLIGLFSVLGARLLFRVYGQIWRYGDIGAFLRLSVADVLACVAYFLLQFYIPAVRTIRHLCYRCDYIYQPSFLPRIKNDISLFL